MTDRERPGGPQYVVPMLYFDSHVFIFLSELFSIYTVIYFLTTVCLYSIDTKVFRWDIYLLFRLYMDVGQNKARISFNNKEGKHFSTTIALRDLKFHKPLL